MSTNLDNITDYFNLSVSVQSLPVPSNIVSRGCVCSKSFTPICCGIDVHKSFVVACIASTNEQGVTTYKSKRFSTFTGDLRRCAAWLSENNCKDVCMESTGKYWIPIYNILEPTCNIVLAHPKYVKAIRGKKTDKRDAKWIADIFKHDLVAGSFIPPADIRQLRDLMRYRWKLTSFTTGEKNRAQKLSDSLQFQTGRCVLRCVWQGGLRNYHQNFGKSSGENYGCSGFRTKRMKATDEEILAAVDGEMCAEQAEKLRIIRSHMDSLELCKLNLDSLILSTAEKYLPQLGLVMTAQVSNPLPQLALSLKSEWICLCFPPRSIFAPGLGLRRKITRVPERRKPPESAGQEPTSNPCWYSVRCALFARNSSRKSETATSLSKSAVDTRKRLLLSPECCSLQFTICSRRMNPTILNSTERATGRLHTVRFLWKKPSSFYNGKVT